MLMNTWYDSDCPSNHEKSRKELSRGGGPTDFPDFRTSFWLFLVLGREAVRVAIFRGVMGDVRTAAVSRGQAPGYPRYIDGAARTGRIFPVAGG